MNQYDQRTPELMGGLSVGLGLRPQKPEPQTQHGVPETVAPLVQSMGELDHALEDLNSQVWKLASKLEPIRYQRPRADQCPHVAEPGSEVVCAVRAKAEQIRTLGQVVQMLIVECEV